MKNNRIYLPQIKHIIAVASGKGGVGKSTIAFSLAHLMAQSGLRVGLLDADLYGPSVPLFMNISAAPTVQDKKYIPHFLHGLHTMSLGFLVKKEEPIMWRGPILQTALRQLFSDVLWPELDILMVDMPPGTGDAHLSIGQSVPLSGVIMVSTGQYLALQDTSRCIRMFQKIKAPIWGLLGNMDTFHCMHCDTQSPLYQSADISGFCVDMGIPYWGSLPYTADMVQDRGINTPLKGTAFHQALCKVRQQILETAHI